MWILAGDEIINLAYVKQIWVMGNNVVALDTHNERYILKRCNDAGHVARWLKEVAHVIGATSIKDIDARIMEGG